MTPAPARHQHVARRLRSVTVGALLVTALAVSGLPAAPGQAARTVGSAAEDGPTDRRAVDYDRFPTRGSTGVPRGWEPRRTYTRDVVVRKAGKVVQDIRIVGGNLVIDAPDVTVRRVEILGGRITNVPESECRNGLLVEDSSILKGGPTSDGDEAAIGIGGYTVRGVEIHGVAEGFRVGGTSLGCGRTKILNTYVHIQSPEECNDWHGDGVQGFDGPPLLIRRTRIVMEERDGCGGTAPFFWPSQQGNARARVDGLLVQGGGVPFRMTTPGSVQGLRIVGKSWFYFPIDVKCSVVSPWEAKIVRLDRRNQPRVVRNQPCDVEAE